MITTSCCHQLFLFKKEYFNLVELESSRIYLQSFEFFKSKILNAEITSKIVATVFLIGVKVK